MVLAYVAANIFERDQVIETVLCVAASFGGRCRMIGVEIGRIRRQEYRAVSAQDYFDDEFSVFRIVQIFVEADTADARSSEKVGNSA